MRGVVEDLRPGDTLITETYGPRNITRIDAVDDGVRLWLEGHKFYFFYRVDEAIIFRKGSK